MATLSEFFEAACTRFGAREMVAEAGGAQVDARLSGEELLRSTQTVARRLLDHGVRRGAHVALLCPNRITWVTHAFALWELGAVVVPLSTLWKRKEIEYALRQADVEHLYLVPQFLKHDYRAVLQQIMPDLGRSSDLSSLFLPQLPTLRAVHFLEEERTRQIEAVADESADTDFLRALRQVASEADRAAIFFTSGTTSQPKAVVHCHAALVRSAQRIAAALGIDETDCWWGHMPLFWTGGFVLGLLASWGGGARVLLHQRFEGEEALELLERERCTIMAGWHVAGPLLEHPDFRRRKLSLRKGSFHPLADQLLSKPHFAVGMYGLSETATCAACARWDEPDDLRLHTAGTPLPGTEIRIVDPATGLPLPPGTTGEICVRGPTLMEGYYKVPRQDVFDPAGFFHTGDLGFLDQGGRLHFTGRLKDVIKTAGVNVAAQEVEEVLAQHEAVYSAHVVGVPHPVRGENIAAFVVLRPGYHVAPEELVTHCKQRTASYKAPRHIFLVEARELPRTGTGKVEKSALRAEAQRRLNPDPSARV